MKPLATVVIHSDFLCNIATATVLCVKLMELKKKENSADSISQIINTEFVYCFWVSIQVFRS